MDQTSQIAAIAVPIAAAIGLVGLIGIPAMALRQATRDAVRIEREWVAIRADRRRAEQDAPTPPVGTTAKIGAQRQGSQTPVAR